LQKVFRQLGVSNIDHRTQQMDFSDQDAMPLFPYLGQSIQSVEENDCLFLVGSNIRLEQPMLAHRIRKASGKGCMIYNLNPQDFEFHFASQYDWSLAPQQWVNALAEVAKCAASQEVLPRSIKSIIDDVQTSEHAQQIFAALSGNAKSSVMFGLIADSHPQASILRALSHFIAKATDSRFTMLARSGNTAAGVLPHRMAAAQTAASSGLNVSEMIAKKQRAYVLFNLEPEFDFAKSTETLKAMQEADFVVVFTPYINDQVKEYANVILPIATFAETDGTFVNNEGRWQSIGKAVPAPGEARAAWKVLRVLANKLGFDEVQYHTSEEIRDELKQKFDSNIQFTSDLSSYDSINTNPENSEENKTYRVSDAPVYAVDNIVRRAKSLQQAVADQADFVALSSKQAETLNVLNEMSVRIIQGKNEH